MTEPGKIPARQDLQPTSPYLRIRDGQPLLVLTTPARWALAVTPDGELQLCSLNGVANAVALRRKIKPTSRQEAVGAAWAEFVASSEPAP